MEHKAQKENRHRHLQRLPSSSSWIRMETIAGSFGKGSCGSEESGKGHYNDYQLSPLFLFLPIGDSDEAPSKREEAEDRRSAEGEGGGVHLGFIAAVGFRRVDFFFLAELPVSPTLSFCGHFYMLGTRSTMRAALSPWRFATGFFLKKANF